MKPSNWKNITISCRQINCQRRFLDKNHVTPYIDSEKPTESPSVGSSFTNSIISLLLVFIYSVPPSVSCTIKELMLFSSCKAPFINEIQKECGVKIDKKVAYTRVNQFKSILLFPFQIEVDSRDKMDGPTLLSYINPTLVTENKRIERPPRPGRRALNVTWCVVIHYML